MAVQATCSAVPQNGSWFVRFECSSPIIIAAIVWANSGLPAHFGTKFQ